MCVLFMMLMGFLSVRLLILIVKRSINLLFSSVWGVFLRRRLKCVCKCWWILRFFFGNSMLIVWFWCGLSGFIERFWVRFVL